jgi:hypothetical protein
MGEHDRSKRRLGRRGPGVEGASEWKDRSYRQHHAGSRSHRCRSVDEYRLFVYPVVVGHGRRLFEDATNVPKLEFVEAKSYRSGVVLLIYRPAVK